MKCHLFVDKILCRRATVRRKRLHAMALTSWTSMAMKQRPQANRAGMDVQILLPWKPPDGRVSPSAAQKPPVPITSMSVRLATKTPNGCLAVGVGARRMVAPFDDASGPTAQNSRQLPARAPSFYFGDDQHKILLGGFPPRQPAFSQRHPTARPLLPRSSQYAVYCASYQLGPSPTLTTIVCQLTVRRVLMRLGFQDLLIACLSRPPRCNSPSTATSAPMVVRHV